MHIFLLISIFISASFAAPLARRMVDMSHVFDETTLKFPMWKKYEMNLVINGSSDDWTWLQYEEFSTSSHTGTHMDAPSHFSKGGINVDQIPPEQLMGPAAVIDITERAARDINAEADINDLLHWESLTGQSLNGTIILLKSGWSRYWSNQTAFFGTPEDNHHNLNFPGLAPEAAQWLVENREIKGVGTETLSLDRGNTTDFMTHVHLLGAGIWIMENVANVDQIPISGAKLYALPMKLGKASGAPTRLIASYPVVIFSPPANSNLV